MTDPVPVLTEPSGQTLDGHVITHVISAVLRAAKSSVGCRERTKQGPDQPGSLESRMEGEGRVHPRTCTDKGLPQGLCLCGI